MPLDEIYAAQRAGASKTTLIELIEALEGRGERVPAALINEIHELVDDEEELDDAPGGRWPSAPPSGTV